VTWTEQQGTYGSFDALHLGRHGLLWRRGAGVSGLAQTAAEWMAVGGTCLELEVGAPKQRAGLCQVVSRNFRSLRNGKGDSARGKPAIRPPVCVLRPVFPCPWQPRLGRATGRSIDPYDRVVKVFRGAPRKKPKRAGEERAEAALRRHDQAEVMLASLGVLADDGHEVPDILCEDRPSLLHRRSEYDGVVCLLEAAILGVNGIEASLA